MTEPFEEPCQCSSEGWCPRFGRIMHGRFFKTCHDPAVNPEYRKQVLTVLERQKKLVTPGKCNCQAEKSKE